MPRPGVRIPPTPAYRMQAREHGIALERYRFFTGPPGCGHLAVARRVELVQPATSPTLDRLFPDTIRKRGFFRDILSGRRIFCYQERSRGNHTAIRKFFVIRPARSAMDHTPAPQIQQTREPGTTVTVRRLTRAETPHVMTPSHGNSN